MQDTFRADLIHRLRGEVLSSGHLHRSEAEVHLPPEAAHLLPGVSSLNNNHSRCCLLQEGIPSVCLTAGQTLRLSAGASGRSCRHRFPRERAVRQPAGKEKNPPVFRFLSLVSHKPAFHDAAPACLSGSGVWNSFTDFSKGFKRHKTLLHIFSGICVKIQPVDFKTVFRKCFSCKSKQFFNNIFRPQIVCAAL